MNKKGSFTEKRLKFEAEMKELQKKRAKEEEEHSKLSVDEIIAKAKRNNNYTGTYDYDEIEYPNEDRSINDMRNEYWETVRLEARFKKYGKE